MSTCLTLPLLFLFRPFSEKDIVSCSLCSVLFCVFGKPKRVGIAVLFVFLMILLKTGKQSVYSWHYCSFFVFKLKSSDNIKKCFVYIFIHLSMYTFLATLLYNSSESFIPIM